jgi:hypothetical protein
MVPTCVFGTLDVRSRIGNAKALIDCGISGSDCSEMIVQYLACRRKLEVASGESDLKVDRVLGPKSREATF